MIVAMILATAVLSADATQRAEPLSARAKLGVWKSLCAPFAEQMKFGLIRNYRVEIEISDGNILTCSGAESHVPHNRTNRPVQDQNGDRK